MRDRLFEFVINENCSTIVCGKMFEIIQSKEKARKFLSILPPVWEKRGDYINHQKRKPLGLLLQIKNGDSRPETHSIIIKNG